MHIVAQFGPGARIYQTLHLKRAAPLRTLLNAYLDLHRPGHEPASGHTRPLIGALRAVSRSVARNLLAVATGLREIPFACFPLPSGIPTSPPNAENRSLW